MHAYENLCNNEPIRKCEHGRHLFPFARSPGPSRALARRRTSGHGGGGDPGPRQHGPWSAPRVRRLLSGRQPARCFRAHMSTRARRLLASVSPCNQICIGIYLQCCFIVEKMGISTKKYMGIQLKRLVYLGRKKVHLNLKSAPI